ncbi:MAG: penicillin-binding transpeptidase domain-containing protein, partial [Planctomycetota bacterium]
MYKRRIKIFLATITLAMLALMGRLAHLQLLHGEDYRLQAEKALQRVEPLPANRGQIVDRKGRILAIDQPCFDLCLDFGLLSGDPAWKKQQMRLIARSRGISTGEQGWQRQVEPIFRKLRARTWRLTRELAGRLEQDPDERAEEIVSKIHGWRDGAGTRVEEQNQAHPVVTGLTSGLAARANEVLPRTIGAYVRPSHRRWYPYGDLACHVIGIAAPVTREDMDARNLKRDQADGIERLQRNYMPWDTIGKTGVEKLAEDLLRGRRGYRRCQLGGRVLEERPAQPGGDVHLTLDIELQRRLTETMRSTGHNGALAVIQVRTGDVLALVSVPTFDVNDYRKNYSDLVQDELNLPLMHRAVAARRPPGSTTKPLTALGGLAMGVISRHSQLSCAPGYVGGNPGAFRCWIYKRYGQSHGHLDVVEALMRSCNAFFYHLGDRIGSERLVQWLAQWGYGDVPGTGLPEEKPGLLLTPRRLRSKYRSGLREVPGYLPADGRFMAIGQGDIGVSVLHVANAMAAIGRDGMWYSPRLCLEAAPDQQRRKLPVSGEDVATVQRGMYKVVNDRSSGTVLPTPLLEVSP